MEEWKDIIGYEGYYQVSDMGRVKSLAKTVAGRRGVIYERILKPYPNHRGYLLVLLSKDNIKWRETIHRLVANHFIDNPVNKPEVNHKDGDKQNNSTWNLEWATRLENAQHSIYVLGKNQQGANHAQVKYSETDIIEMLRLWKTGKYTKAEIGRRYGMGKDYASSVINRKTWKHLNII